MDAYDGELTMRHAIAQYFERNGFGPDGGYDDRWVHFQYGPLSFKFPNTPARKRAVRFHDMHHVVTGYATDAAGEFEISAWEIGAGCGSFVVAWQLNLGGLAMGALTRPSRTLRAFVRGRRARSLYHGDAYDALLDRSVADVRAHVGADLCAEVDASVSDRVLFALSVLVGLVVGTASMMLMPLMLPVVSLMWWLDARAQVA